MDEREIIALLEAQTRQYSEREQSYLEKIEGLSVEVSRLTGLLHQQEAMNEQQADKITALTSTIQSMEEAMRERDVNILNLKAQNKALGKLLNNKSEKIRVDASKTAEPGEPAEPAQTGEAPAEPAEPAKTGEAQEAAGAPEKPKEKPAYNPKDRGNNNARRKEFFDIETVIEDIYPDDPVFDRQKAKELDQTESILYEFIPGKFIKRIYRQHNYIQEDTVYCCKTPKKTPFLNSNYDSSFIAGILQLRFVYALPVERIILYFTENGFELCKPTAHGFIRKVAIMMVCFEVVLRKVILGDDYICMDETYYKILVKEKNEQGKGVRKGFIWAAMSRHTKLVQFFYENGSRTMEVLTEYIEAGYEGAIQSDGLANYKIIETEQYPGAIRIGCLQHCKRKFLELMPDKDAEQIVTMTNLLYHEEHKIQPGWTPERILAHRAEYAPPILAKIKTRLLEIQNDPLTLPKSPIAKAANYMLNEFDAISNYTLRHDYDLDNNAIERVNRYISLSRRNSLFCGSHAGAKRMALIYSLACSCRMNNINTFQYFTDILNRLAVMKPNAPDEDFINLLPHRWHPKLE